MFFDPRKVSKNVLGKLFSYVLKGFCKNRFFVPEILKNGPSESQKFYFEICHIGHKKSRIFMLI
jgi:hypothetical protein